jgi:lipopolysaccharide transport system permease protein
MQPTTKTAAETNGVVAPAQANGAAPPRSVPPPADAVPVLYIRPSGVWNPIDFRELWRHRELLYFLTWRDVKVRYKQSVLGAAWAIIQPLFTMVVFTLLFGVLARMPSGDIPYPVFSYTALLPWTYFANALANASNSLVGSAHLINKIYFPRLFIPISAILAGLVDYLIASVVLFAILMPWYGYYPPLSALITIPLLTVLVSGLALGVSLVLSALNVQYRDVRHAVPFLIQLWMFATPVVYSLNLLPERIQPYRWVFALNPLAGAIEGYRSALLGLAWDFFGLGISVAFCALALVVGALFFRRVEDDFADII